MTTNFQNPLMKRIREGIINHQQPKRLISSDLPTLYKLLQMITEVGTEPSKKCL